MPHDVRDQIVDFVRHWSEASEIGAGRFVEWLGVTGSKFYDWRERYAAIVILGIAIGRLLASALFHIPGGI